MAALSRLQNLTLNNTSVTGTALAALADLPLNRIYIQGGVFNNAGMANLKRFGQLSRLTISQTAITDAGVVHLRELNSLTELSLAQNKTITDAALVHLRGLKQLQFLNVRDTRVSPAGARALQQVLLGCRVIQ